MHLCPIVEKSKNTYTLKLKKYLFIAYFFAKINITMEDDMKNITIVGIDNNFVKSFAKNIADKLGYNYLDANEQFDKILLANNNYPMFILDEILAQKENLLIDDLISKDKTVISISDDMFLSNEHYKKFEFSTTILVLDENLDKTRAGIQNLIKKYTKFTFNKNEIKTNDIIKIIRG